MEFEKNILHEKDLKLLENLSNIKDFNNFKSLLKNFSNFPEIFQIIFIYYDQASKFDNKEMYLLLIKLFNYYYDLLTLNDNQSKNITLVVNSDAKINVNEPNDKLLIDTNTILKDTDKSINAQRDSNKENLKPTNKLLIGLYVTHIVKLIIKNIKSETQHTNIPPGLFTGNFFKYIIKNRLFFTAYHSQKSLFRYIISDIAVINHFKYKFIDDNKHFLNNYVIYSDLLYKELQQSLLTFALLNKAEIKICINFISLVNDYIKNITVGDCTYYELKTILIANTVRLYNTIYLNILKNIEYDTQSLVVYNYTNMDSVLMSNLRLDSKSNIIKNTLNYIKFGESNICALDKMKFFLNIQDKRIEEFDKLSINIVHSNTIEKIPYIANNTLKNGLKIDKILTLITDILYSDLINIHIKSDLIIKTSPEIFKDLVNTKFMLYLVKLFNECDKYSTDTGFMRKFKFRTSILNIIIYSNSSNLFNSISPDIYTEFITFYVNHIISLIDAIVIIRNNIIKSTAVQYINNPSNILLIKYVVYLHASFKFVFTIFNNILENTECKKLFYYKITELIYSLLNIIIEQNLINDTLYINKRNIFQDKSKFLFNSILNNLVLLIHKISDNEEFIRQSLDNNSCYYNDKYIDTMIKVFGNFEINLHLDNNINTIHLNNLYRIYIKSQEDLRFSTVPPSCEQQPYVLTTNTENKAIDPVSSNNVVSIITEILDVEPVHSNSVSPITNENHDVEPVHSNSVSPITNENPVPCNAVIPYTNENPAPSNALIMDTLIPQLVPYNFLQNFNYIKPQNAPFVNDKTEKIIEDILNNDVCYNYYKKEPVKNITNVKIETVFKKYSNLINIEKQQKLNVYTEEIPEEFLDPLLLIPVENPLEIPEVKIILDSYTIFNHLIFNNTNPFTNNPLTKKDLIAYNKEVLVKKRVDTYNDNFNSWKKNHLDTD